MDPSREFVALVNETRSRCLWFLRPDDLPCERQQQLSTLELIERYGERADWIRSRRLREWLRRNSKAAFSVS